MDKRSVGIAAFIAGFAVCLAVQERALPDQLKVEGLATEATATIGAITLANGLLSEGTDSGSTSGKETSSETYALLRKWTLDDLNSGAMALRGKAAITASRERAEALDRAIDADLKAARTAEVEKLLAYASLFPPSRASGGWVDDPYVRQTMTSRNIKLHSEYRKDIATSATLARRMLGMIQPEASANP